MYKAGVDSSVKDGDTAACHMEEEEEESTWSSEATNSPVRTFSVRKRGKKEDFTPN